MNLPEKAQLTLIILLCVFMAGATSGGVFYCIGMGKGRQLEREEAMELAREYMDRRDTENAKAQREAVDEAWGLGYRAAQVDASAARMPEGE